MNRFTVILGLQALVCAVICTSQLVTLEMACEMECLKTKLGHAHATWDSPEAVECRQECLENPLTTATRIMGRGETGYYHLQTAEDLTKETGPYRDKYPTLRIGYTSPSISALFQIAHMNLHETVIELKKVVNRMKT